MPEQVMKRFLFVLLVSIPFFSFAQERGRLYNEMCNPLQAVFCDYVERESSTNVITNSSGEYVGTLIDDALYGWGRYTSNSGICSYGQYRNGRFMFGIILSESVAKVGGEENYTVYDLKTGEIIRIHTIEGNVPLDYPFVPSAEEPVPQYSFKKERYASGDYFIGEFFKGKRHGYGIYFWANGDIWYGEYKEGYRNGYGMLLKADHRVFYGKWLGDSRVDD